VAKLGFTQGWNGAAPLVLENTTEAFHVTTQDQHGNTLIGTGAVAFDVAGVLHKVSAGGGDSQGFAGAAGSGSVVAHTATSTATLAVTVVPLTAIGGVTGTVRPNTVSGNVTYGNVDVVANNATGSVYGPSCSWTTSDPSVTVYSQSAASLEQPAKSSTQFVLGLPGTYTATCTVGAVSTSVSLQR
jgi:hypothetical protein